VRDGVDSLTSKKQKGKLVSGEGRYTLSYDGGDACRVGHESGGQTMLTSSWRRVSASLPNTRAAQAWRDDQNDEAAKTSSPSVSPQNAQAGRSCDRETARQLEGGLEWYLGAQQRPNSCKSCMFMNKMQPNRATPGGEPPPARAARLG
jgi:hypothetical protein